MGGKGRGSNLTSQTVHSKSLVRFYTQNCTKQQIQFYVRPLLQPINQVCKQNTTSNRKETQGKQSPYLKTFKYMLAVNLLLTVS